jgi:hypothetical protein
MLNFAKGILLFCTMKILDAHLCFKRNGAKRKKTTISIIEQSLDQNENQSKSIFSSSSSSSLHTTSSNFMWNFIILFFYSSSSSSSLWFQRINERH